MKKHLVKSTALVLLAVLFFTLFPFSACALNTDYLYREKWENSSNVTVKHIEGTSREYTLDGNFGHYEDHSSMCIYTYFDVKESSCNSNSDVRVSYTFRTPSEEYCVIVNESGICDGTDKDTKLFSVGSNFTKNNGGGCFISAVQYNGNEDACSVDVAIYFSHIYRICDGLSLVRPTTTKAQKTTKAKTTKQKTLKATAKNSAKSKSSTTKYVPTGNIKGYSGKSNKKYYKSSDNVETGTTYAPSGDVVNKKSKKKNSPTKEQGNNIRSVVTQHKVKFTKPAVILMIFAGVLGLAGLIVLLIGLLKKDKPSTNSDDNEKE